MLSTELVLSIVAMFMVVCPLIVFMKKGVNANNAKRRVLSQVGIFTGMFALVVVFNAGNVLAETTTQTNAITGTIAQGLGFLAAALATGCSALGAGLAVAAAAPAAIGAISENSENFGKAMIFVALGEGVAIYGLLISILIMNKI